MTPAERKKAEAAGWIYDYSKPLEMEYAHRKTDKGIELVTGDNVYYRADEVRILNQAGVKITPAIHIVKKIFKGEIVSNKTTK